MNKSDKIAIAVLILLLVGWILFGNKYFAPKPPPAAPSNTASPSNSSPALTDTPNEKPAPTALTNTTLSPAPPPPEQTAHLRNEFVDIELTSYGGGIKTITLLKYETNATGKGSKENVVLNKYGGIPALSLDNLAGADAAAVFTMTPSENSVVFETTTASGIKVRKTFKLAEEKEFNSASDYVIKCEVALESTVPQTLNKVAVRMGAAAPRGPEEGGTLWLPIVGTIDNRGMYVGVDANDGKDTKHFVLSEFKKGSLEEKHAVHWLGIRNQYFTMLLTPSQPAAGSTAWEVTLPATKELPEGMLPAAATANLVLPPMELQAGKNVSLDFSFYAGPKEYKRLIALGKKQDDVLQFGRFIFWQFTWLSAVSKVMLLSLLGLKKLVLNYGVAIIVLTIIIRGLFWPLTGYGTRQMKKMQALAPQLKVLQEKHKGDQMKVHTETAKLWKEHKVHPAGGCLPMLVQIPFFVAFYSILVSATELWGAPFLWVHDLTQPDAIFTAGWFRFDLLLLLMAATQIWQAKITPSTDPAQAKMMMFMPILMVVMMYAWKFSAALVLYWTVSNLITILQTYITHKPAEESAKNQKPKIKTK